MPNPDCNARCAILKALNVRTKFFSNTVHRRSVSGQMFGRVPLAEDV